MPAPLTPEETFLWDCARSWRSPGRIAVPATLDWSRVAEVGVANRMAFLLKQVLQETGLWESLPEAPRQAIGESADRLAENAELLGEALADYLGRAAGRGLDTVVLKGLSISQNIYGVPAMRPGGDVDLLVRRDQVADSLAILETMGIGAYWPNLLADAFYERHHLHQQRSTKDLRVWFEIHWALDHPYTLFTIDYDAILDRARPGTLLGGPVLDLDPGDLLLTLAVHLVKHAVYLPDAVGRPDLARLVLADGMLMYYLDIAETVSVLLEKIEWERLAARARASGTAVVLGSVLRAARHLLDAPVPEEALRALPVRGSGPVTRRAMRAVVEREIAEYLGEPPNRFWDAMRITNGAFILRPIRLLESASYFLPPADFLRRRYNGASLRCRIGHFLGALKEFAVFGRDSIVFGIERHRRLKRIGYSTSLFNRLESEG